jgi:nucleoside-diphosphate-sugar epimerase
MVLVTGATGFLGSELVKQLVEKGQPVRAIKREASIIPDSLKNLAQVEWINADILNYHKLEDAFEGIEYVYHCAAFISFNPNDKKKLEKINIEGTSNIVNLCLENNIQKLVHVSSVAAIGNAKNGCLISEKNQWEFDGKQHGYSISKYESEMEVWRGIAEGLNAVIVNPALIIGKNAGIKGSGELFETVRKGLKLYTRGCVGLVDVEDVAKSMIRLMESEIKGQRFLINAENWNYKDLFKEIANQSGTNPPAIEARPWMLGIAWRGAKIGSLITGKHCGLTKATARSSVKSHHYSNEKIKQAIGIDFKPIKQSIQEICNALKEKHRE